MTPIRNIRAIKTILGTAKGMKIDGLPAHINKLSTVLPIHISAITAMHDPVLANFVMQRATIDLKKIRRWEEAPVWLAEPFFKLNLFPRELKVIDQKGAETTIRVLADRDAKIAGAKVSLVFDGKEHQFDLVKDVKGVMEGSLAIIPPPFTVSGPELQLSGRAASYFIGIGRAYVPLRPDISKFPSEIIPDEKVDEEIEAAEKAFQLIIDQHDKVLDGEKIATLLRYEIPKIVKLIEDKRYNFKLALEKSLLPNIKMFLRSTDDNNRPLIGPLHDKNRAFGGELQITYNKLILARHNELVDLMAGVESVLNLYTEEKVVLICRDVDFVEAASLNPDKIAGVAEEKGGIKSHTSIACKSLEIPLVIGIEGATETVKNGDVVIVDGERGVIIVNPNKMILEKFTRIRDESIILRKSLRETYVGKKAFTKDETPIEIIIAGNSKSVSENERLDHEGVTRIGLLRTEESLDVVVEDGAVKKRDRAPSLDEQVNFYRGIYKTSKNVVIRTMDVNGSDKYIIYLGQPQMTQEGNVVEGIGLCMDDENHKAYNMLFRDQIKAILIASKIENVVPKIEFPMVLSVEQFRMARELVKNIAVEMSAHIYVDTEEHRIHTTDPESIQFYAMVEHPELFEPVKHASGPVPEAETVRLEIDELAREAHGLSIGTNDLTAGLLSKNRNSSRTKFNELDPKVLSAIKATIEAVNAANAAKADGRESRPLLVCGDMASDPISVPVLMGLGIRELSVDASAINVIKCLVSNVDIKNCEKLVEELKEIRTADEARKHVANFILHNMEYGNWKGLETLRPILMKYIYFADGMTYNPKK